MRIGIDVGGTNIAAGIIDNDGMLIAKRTLATQADKGKDAVCSNIREIISLLLHDADLDINDVLSIGLGLPGSVDRDSLRIYCLSNMHCMDGADIRKIFYDLPKKTEIFIDNDANAAALGEYIFIKERGISNFVMLTIGTGIGCGIIINGKIYRGFNGLAGEAGHIVIERNGRMCGCGRNGCFERYASVSGLVLTARELMQRSEGSLLWDLCRGDLQNIDGKMIFKALEKNDKTAAAAFESFIEYLGIGVSNIIMLIQPEVLALSGAVTEQGDIIINPLRERCARQRYSTGGGHTEICLRQCADAGIIGAAMLCRG